YWLADAAGGVHAFGAAEHSGEADGCNLPAGIVGIAASGAGTVASPPPARPNCGLPTTTTTSGGGGSPRTLAAVADADVEAADPGRNNGSGSQMAVDGSPKRRAYLAFDTSGLGAVSSARLRVFVKGGSANGPAVHRAGGGWSERSITWANQPGPAGAALANRGALGSGQWAEWDVTAAVAAGASSFVLVADSSDGTYLATREDGRPAQLVVTTSGGTSPPDPGDPTDPGDPPGGRPNFLVINTDDQRLDGTLEIMPKTRQWLAAAGTSFTQGFATTPLCCPSRSGLFSGRYTHNHGNLNNQTTDRLDLDATVQRYLHDAGYQTGLVGKFLLNWSNSTRPPHFDRWALTSGGYYDVAFGTDQGSLRADYSTWETRRQAERILNAFETRDADPFFLYVAPQAPHDPWDPEPAYRTAEVGAWNGNPAVHETDRSDKPAWVRDFHVDFDEGAATRASQLRLLKSADDMVDSVMRRLTALGEADNTVVIFTSDNGYLWGEHGMRSKYNPYDGSVRVPFIVRWPGKVAAGAVDPRPVGNVDITPSLLAAAGVSPRLVYPFDGRPFLDPGGLSGVVRPEAYLEYFMDEHRDIPDWSAIRTTRLNYVEYHDGDRIVYREYYDLVADPWELNNLFGDASGANDPDTSGLSARLARYRTCRGTTGTTACA
ncbi:MAG: sulfatase-like hydrolase/transferase, partial [Acidimicrobiia bacterium]